MKDKICIITNEKIYEENQKKFCDNIDIKSIPEGLESFFDIVLIGRGSNQIRSKEINVKNVSVSKNLFDLFKKIKNNFKAKNLKYLVISISPFTFMAIIFLKLFRRKVFLYLRSDGFEEYKSILGLPGPLIYGLMFYISSIMCDLIACRKRILRGKRGIIVHPSQLNENWKKNISKPSLDKVQLLYVGRIRVEKGIFSLSKMIGNTNLKLSVVTSEMITNYKNSFSNIEIINFRNIDDSIIKFYDECNIFILPSFTEAHPQVLDEALARMRPVIVFDEISHVARDRKGVYIANRNLESLNEKIKFIINNYTKIQEEIKENKLPSKKIFINQMKNIFSKEIK
tara:strand:+ start:3571 stop:4593 length:1023 start_codon:yes stop_codon:yes gene_type:complete